MRMTRHERSRLSFLSHLVGRLAEIERYAREASVEFDAQQREVWSAIRQLRDAERSTRRSARRALAEMPYIDENMLPPIAIYASARDAVRSFGRSATRNRVSHAPSATPPPPPFNDSENYATAPPPKRSSFGITGRTASSRKLASALPRPAYTRVSASTRTSNDRARDGGGGGGERRCVCVTAANRCPPGPVRGRIEVANLKMPLAAWSSRRSRARRREFSAHRLHSPSKSKLRFPAAEAPVAKADDPENWKTSFFPFIPDVACVSGRRGCVRLACIAGLSVGTKGCE